MPAHSIGAALAHNRVDAADRSPPAGRRSSDQMRSASPSLKSGALSLNQQFNSETSGSRVVTDYDHTANSINYECDGDSGNPFHYLAMNNCTASGAHAYNVWYINATGQNGDGYWACDDTAVGSATSSTVLYLASAGHDYCSYPANNYQMYCGEAVADTKHTFTLYNNTSKARIEGILANDQGGGNLLFDGSNNSVFDGGSTTIYAAMLTLSSGGMYEVVHNYLGSKGSKESEIFTRCPIGYVSDCRDIFNGVDTDSNVMVINGTPFWMNATSGSSTNSSLIITWENDHGNITSYNILGTVYSGTDFDNDAWVIYSPGEYSSPISATPVYTTPNAPQTYNYADFYYNLSTLNGGTRVFANFTLTPGQGIIETTSTTVQYLLLFGTNSVLSLYQCTNAACTTGFSLWSSSNTASADSDAYASFADGQLSIYNSSGSVVWSATTASSGSGATFAIQEDGNLAIYPSGTNPSQSATAATWTSGTGIINQIANGWNQPNGW